jgi:hypothetical protein
MRRIHLTEEVTLRFPERSEEFDEGVELGILAQLPFTCSIF